VAAVEAANGDIGRYVGLACIGRIAFRIRVLRPWAARHGNAGA
jgi:hypothetical protein